MRILFIADVPLSDPTSGSEQVLYQQATGLAQSGMEIYAITRQITPPSLVIRNVADVQEGCFQASPQDFGQFFYCLARYPSKLFDRFSQGAPFSIAVCHQPFNYMALTAKTKFRSLPILYVFHSPSHKEYLLANTYKSRLKTLPQVQFRKMVEGFCLRRSKKIMVLSKYMNNRVRTLHNISKDKVINNPGGVNLDIFSPPEDRELLKKDLGLPENKFHLFTVRNLEPRMGLDNLVKCMSILKDKKARIHLVIGGEGSERPYLEKLINEYGLNRDVTMRGFIPIEILPKYYGAADFFVLPTRSLEGFGLVTPESMACGTPVLGTPVGGTIEILSNFDSRLLFKDVSPMAMAEGIQVAINKYFLQDGKYDELRAQCREYAERNYSWQRHVDQLMSIIQTVIRARHNIS